MNDAKIGLGLFIISCCISIMAFQSESSHDRVLHEEPENTEVLGKPEKYLYEDRHLSTKQKCEGHRFRFVCYNILYDSPNLQHKSDFTHPHCPIQYLNLTYRLPLTIKEISGYNGDIICLQEVQSPTYRILNRTLSKDGFKGLFIPKDDGTDGLATFYRTGRFRLMREEKVILRKVIEEERFQDLWMKIKENQKFSEKFMKGPRPLLMAIFQSKDDPSKYILVVNIHLHSKVFGCHLRILQLEIILREMRRMQEKFIHEHKIQRDDISSILAGDFNTPPYSAPIQLLTKGYAQSNHFEWYSGGKPEYLPDMHLTNPTLFKCANGYRNITNFYQGKLEQLDYIFINPKYISVDKVIPPPNFDDVIKHSAIPSKTYPSDHIAQIVELSWKARI